MSEWRHARWLDPHPPEPRDAGEMVRASGLVSTSCLTCGEVLIPAPVSESQQ